MVTGFFKTDEPESLAPAALLGFFNQVRDELEADSYALDYVTERRVTDLEIVDDPNIN